MQLDDTFLAGLGLEKVLGDDKGAFLRHAEQELIRRVGSALSDSLGEEKSLEFENILDAGDPGAASKWLEQNSPHYSELIVSETEKLRQEIAAHSGDLTKVV